MTAISDGETNHGTSALAPQRLAQALASADRSAWLSWASFALGLHLASAGTPTLGGLAVIGIAVLAFFVAVALIQRHMRLSLKAASFGDPQCLVVTGVFRYSRNPIYVAFLLPLASLAAVSVTAAVTATLVYIVTMNRFVIRNEEAHLTRRFGASYLAYRRATPRWLVL